MDNAEIARRMIEAKAVDFDQIGKLVAELGPQLAVSKADFKFVLVGEPFTLACVMTAFETPQMIESLRRADVAGAMGR